MEPGPTTTTPVADPGVPANLDEVAARDTDRNGARGVIYAVASSPRRLPLIWIGTDDGLIQVTTDEGATWTNVTPAAVTSWSRVTTIEASHFEANAAYASVDRHQLNDFNPHIYRTRDMGKTWQDITRGLPAGVYVHVVKEDPARRGLLFAGTERGLPVLVPDDGDRWSLQLNLPVTSMRDFEIRDHDLIVATHGRGFWVIDDISPLRQITDAVAQSPAYLFKPGDAIVWSQGGDNGTPTQRDEPQASNAPNGAAIDYYLKAASTSVTLEILDAAGTVLTTFASTPAAGAGGGAGAGRAVCAGEAAAPRNPEYIGAAAPRRQNRFPPQPAASRDVRAGRRRARRWCRGGGAGAAVPGPIGAPDRQRTDYADV